MHLVAEILNGELVTSPRPSPPHACAASSLGAELYGPFYGREHAGHVWLVDPLLQTLEVLRLDGAGYRIVGAWRAEAVVQCEPFEALPIRLADLWSA